MLGAAPQTKIIGGVEYAVRPLNATKSLVVLARVLRMAAPSFGDIASLRQASAAVMQLLAGVAAELDEATLLYVCGELAAVTIVTDGANRLPLDKAFDVHFEGRLVELFEWLRFAAGVTYGPLATWLKSQAEKAAAEATPDPGAAAAAA